MLKQHTKGRTFLLIPWRPVGCSCTWGTPCTCSRQLAGWWLKKPSWKIWKSMGRIIPYMKWKIKVVETTIKWSIAKEKVRYGQIWSDHPAVSRSIPDYCRLQLDISWPSQVIPSRASNRRKDPSKCRERRQKRSSTIDLKEAPLTVYGVAEGTNHRIT